MTRTTTAQGTSLAQALTRAIAELLDVDAGEVDVRVEVAGAKELTGRLAFELEVSPEAADDDTATDEGAAVAAASQVGIRSEAAPDVTAADAADEDTAEEDTATAGSGAAGTDDRVGARSDDEDGTAAEPRRGVRDDEAAGRDRAVRGDGQPTIDVEELDEEADAAADFLEGLLDALDLPGDLRIKVHEDHAEIEVVEIGSGALIGRRGQTLEAIQELVRCSLQRQFQRRARVKIDAEGYRARRMEKLLEKTEEAIDAALDSGEPQRLEPMDVFERKVVHQLVAEVEGLASRSQGREPARRVVIERE